MKKILITTLAEYQTAFWIPVGIALRAMGYEPGFLSFDDRSTEMLEKADFPTFLGNTPPPRDIDGCWNELLAEHGLDRLNYWFTHERYAFNLTDTYALKRKLVGAVVAAKNALSEFAPDGKTMLVQELGGFLSVVGAFHAARSRGIDNWFIEPSFFRGRLLYLRNQFSAADIEPASEAKVTDAVEEYLARTIETASIVIPEKDRHQYTTAFRKIINIKNGRRLAEKLIDKHIFGKKQEFGHIGGHVTAHAKMLVNSRILSGHYTSLRDCKPFVYYPLHVPGDMALTLRSPAFLDQLAFIDYLCRSVPPGYNVAVKEHPAMIGAIDAKRLIKLTARYDNLAILPPSTNNFEVINQAKLVVSINSKSGAEAGLLGKKVLVMGDAFYRRAPFSVPVDNIQDLDDHILTSLDGEIEAVDQARVRTYFAALWPHTYPGELYVPESENVATFALSMEKALGLNSSDRAAE